MQVNRRVWRGFFDVGKLEWDIGYNAGAGAEILAQLFTRYGMREANERPENAARATYAAYNGGPDAYRRYRRGRVPRKLRAIDLAFWEKYQAIAAGQGLDFVLCVDRWGTTPSRARLSTGPVASTSKCCISSRSSRATSTMPARHASLLDRLVPGEEPFPGCDVARVDGGDFLRVRRVAAQRLEVSEDAGLAVGDLPQHLRLVHELGLHDALDRVRGLGVDRSPCARAGEIGAQVDARLRGRCGAAAERAGDGDHDQERTHHATPRNPRTPRRNSSSRS